VISCVALTIALGGTSYATVLQVPRNSVGPAQLKTSAVTNKKIAANAVTSAKVQNGTLLPADFKASSVPAGPAGPVGPAGPAGAPGLSGVERVESTSASNSAAVKSHTTTCPTGKRLLGGSARLNPSLVGVGTAMSFPDNDNIYRVTAREFAATAGNWSLTVFAVCANAS
jgi:hypothetical protein